MKRQTERTTVAKAKRMHEIAKDVINLIFKHYKLGVIPELRLMSAAFFEVSKAFESILIACRNYISGAISSREFIARVQCAKMRLDVLCELLEQFAPRLEVLSKRLKPIIEKYIRGVLRGKTADKIVLETFTLIRDIDKAKRMIESFGFHAKCKL